MAFILTQEGYLQILANDLSIADLTTKDHDLLDGLTDDDHTIYLLVDGSRDMTGNLTITKSTPVITMDGSGANAAATIIGDANRTTASDSILEIQGKWNGTEVGTIIFAAGPDTTNKDDGRIFMDVKSGGSMARAVWIDHNKNVLFYGGLQVFREIGAAPAWMSVGVSRSANESARIDLIGDTTYTAYGLRLIRNAGGANASSQIVHRGTGALDIAASEAGTITFATSGTTRLTIGSTGTFTFGNGLAIKIDEINALNGDGLTLKDDGGNVGILIADGGGVELPIIPSGATQAGAGAAADELWKTASHASLPDNVVMIGV